MDLPKQHQKAFLGLFFGPKNLACELPALYRTSDEMQKPGKGASGSLPLCVPEFVRVSSESTEEGERQIWKGASDPGYTTLSTENLWLAKANSLGLGLPLPDKALISRSQIGTFTLAFCGNASFLWGGCRQHASLCRVKFGKYTVFLWF